jgi:hypothetical protein
MAVTYAKATESTYKAGANVSSTATGAAYLLAFGLMAEGKINVATEFDWSTWYTTYGATYPAISEILVDAATNLVAINVINYDMSGFTNIQEAVSRINTLYTLYVEDLNLLKTQLTKDFLNRFGA